jgi:hypothetical protein
MPVHGCRRHHGSLSAPPVRWARANDSARVIVATPAYRDHVDREQAWDAILTALPEGWRAGRPSYDPGHGRWDVWAIGPKRGGRHGPPPESIRGEGPDELAALIDLAERLDTA